MGWLSTFRDTRILKARPKWRKTRTTQRLDALHRRMGAAVGVDLFKGIQKFKRRVEPEKVYEAWKSGDYSKVMETIPWEEMRGDIRPSLETGAGVFTKAAGLTFEGLPAPLKSRLRWDTHNPRIREWIHSRTAENFTNLTQSSAENIQAAVRAGMNQSLTPTQVAARLRDSIGLLPRHAVAVKRYASGLGEKGYPPSSIQKLGSAYADRLLNYRAEMIARTETRLATNSGQMSVWRQAADEGLIDRETTGKRWIVDGDPCEDCAAMDGVLVPIDSPFIMDDGTTVDFPPHNVHPHCFCGLEIVYGVNPDDFDT